MKTKGLSRTIGLVFVLLIVLAGAGFALFNYSASSSGNFESNASCPANQFATSESTDGSFQCSIVTYGTCPVNQFVTAITTTSLNCALQSAVSTEVAAGCGANSVVNTESANGGLGCTVIGSTEVAGGCGAGSYVTTESANGGLACGSPNFAFSANINTCTDTTLTTKKMMGFALSYTTKASSSGNIIVGMVFRLTMPASAGAGSTYQMAFGTGTAPICNAAATGTTIGNGYSMTAISSSLQFAQTDVVVISGLTSSTTYWFDVQVTDSSTIGWIYATPQAGFVEQ